VYPERVEPGPGQESVWDYPRPPALQPAGAALRVEFEGTVIAQSTSGLRICETSQPPAYYFPPTDVRLDLLLEVSGNTFCEWKGLATYFDVEVDGQRIEQAAWTYRSPSERYAAIADHLAFYAQKLDCFVADERVVPNEGSFYGGWVTSKVVGPFKGAPGTLGW
jgi:uncharacterized protein (DUF427 family)